MSIHEETRIIATYLFNEFIVLDVGEVGECEIRTDFANNHFHIVPESVGVDVPWIIK